MGESVPDKILSIHHFENSPNKGSQKRGLTVYVFFNVFTFPKNIKFLSSVLSRFFRGMFKVCLQILTISEDLLNFFENLRFLSFKEKNGNFPC